MSDTDPEKLADQLEREAKEMEGRSERLDKQAAETRAEWERKRADPGVPGAPPREDESDDQRPESPDPQSDAQD